MNKIYILLSVSIILLFSACSPVVMTPEEIDSLAIKPNKMDKLFSPPKKGYARLIMYRENTNYSPFLSYSVMIKYNPSLDKNGYWVKEKENRVLCKMKNDSSCIVNIKAENRVALLQFNQRRKYAVLFTPKDGHIYCINVSVAFGIWAGQLNYDFKNARECVDKYKAMYKPKHREYQKKWFEELVKKR